MHSRSGGKVVAVSSSYKDMNVNKFRIPTTKHCFKEESVKLSKSKHCSLFMMNAEKWGAKI